MGFVEVASDGVDDDDDDLLIRAYLIQDPVPKKDTSTELLLLFFSLHVL